MIAQVASVAFVAGLSTSFGPCAVPRYLALIGVVAQQIESNALRSRVTFYFGTIAAYVSLAVIGGFAARVYADSTVLQIGLAIAFLWTGIASLVVRTRCAHSTASRSSVSSGFIAGFVSSLTLAPCCAPALFALAAMFAMGASIQSAVVGFAAFLAGHLAPTFFVGDGVGRIVGRLPMAGVAAPLRAVGAACMIALGLYYGIGA